MGSIIALLIGKSIFGKTITEPFARIIAYAALVLIIVGALWGAKCAYDSHIIGAHDAKQAAATAKADKNADDNAATSRVTDVTREQNEATQAQEAINEAKRTGADPRAAYYGCVRKQQSARSAGQPPPVC